MTKKNENLGGKQPQTKLDGRLAKGSDLAVRPDDVKNGMRGQGINGDTSEGLTEKLANDIRSRLEQTVQVGFFLLNHALEATVKYLSLVSLVFIHVRLFLRLIHHSFDILFPKNEDLTKGQNLTGGPGEMKQLLDPTHSFMSSDVSRFKSEFNEYFSLFFSRPTKVQKYVSLIVYDHEVVWGSDNITPAEAPRGSNKEEQISIDTKIAEELKKRGYR